MRNQRQQSKKLFYTTIGLMVFIAGMGIGFIAGTNDKSYDQLSYEEARDLLDEDLLKSTSDKAADFELFWRVWTLVQQKYVDQPVDDEALLYGAIAGIVEGIDDPYSLFFTPEDSEKFLSEINGSFEGIGAEVGLKEDQLTIIAPLSGSPAEASGLLAGDRVLAIDGVETAFMSLDDAVNRIRGEGGTNVLLTIERSGEEDFLDIAVTRDRIKISSVEWNLLESEDKKIVHLQLTHFNSDTPAAFKEAVNEFLLEQPDGIVLDLRNNPGGFLDASIEIASQFIDEGLPVVFEEGSDGVQDVYTATGASPLGGIPLVVLINGGSASAAEILAGALQDYELATLIGTTSFGKGTVQDLQTFEDGSSLKLTVARWLTPKKNLINKIGIYPDYYVDRTAEDYSNEVDPQLDNAINYLKDSVQYMESNELFVPEVEQDVVSE